MTDQDAREADGPDGGAPAASDRRAPPGAADDTLAIVALALGVAALALSAIPFYGMMLGLPLAVVAVVLGLLGRRRRAGGRGIATTGAVTGGIALTITIGWVVTMMVPFWGFGSDTRITVGQSTTEHVAAPSAVVEAPEATPDPDEDPEAMEVDPGEETPPPGALEEASGEVALTLDGDEHHLELTECTLGGRHGDGYLRGSGPDGRVLLQATDTFRGGLDLLLVVEVEGAPPQVLLGEQRGAESSERSTLFDRRRLEVVGSLRDALDEEPVGVSLAATCR